MKRFILVSFTLLLISISSSAKIKPEDYGNIRVDTIWWEGPQYRHYTKMIHMTITNIGDTKIEGSLAINDRYGQGVDYYGDTIYYDYGIDAVRISLMPNETKEYVFRFTPYYLRGEAENIAHLCLTAEYTDNAVITYDIVCDDTKRIKNECTLTLSDIEHRLDTGIDYTIPENVPTITDNLPVVEWKYKNIEDFHVFNICAIGLYTAKYSEGRYKADKQIDSDFMFEGIGEGETKSGYYVTESFLEDGKYYMIRMLYGLLLDDPNFGTLWSTILSANDPFVFKVELPTGIKEIEANEDDLPVYTLNGIRIADTRNLPKGVYIRNGKKFLVK